jgi:chemotaxis protein MotB
VSTPRSPLHHLSDRARLDYRTVSGESDELGEGDQTGRAEAPDELAAQAALAEREERQFAAAEYDLRQAIQDLPELSELAESLIVDRTPEGLRIQLVDQDRTSMFPLGSSEMRDPARKLMALVAQIVRRLPNKISVTGHTDATPYAGTRHYSNWELSTDRANASRRQLVESGLSLERIARVIGVADREPLIAAQPGSPRNRRISIVLLREADPPATRTLAQR